MKTATTEQISNLISFFEDSAYVTSTGIRELAEELMDQDDDIEDVESYILLDCDCDLDGYEYIECENEGSYNRHIFHKIEE